MERVVRIFHSFEDEEKANKEYLLGLTPAERIDILLEINQRVFPDFNAPSTRRLSRVYRVIKPE